MALFTKQIKTIKGEALAAKALGGQSMRFTRIVLGDGQLSGQSPAELEGLLGEKVSLPVAESYREDNSTWTVGAPFDNKDLSIGFYWREVGVYAQDPDEGEILFSYASAQDAPDYIPPLTGGRWEKRIYVSEKVSSAANVTVDASKSVLYAPKEDLEKHVSDKENPHSVTAAQAGAAPSSHLVSKGHIFHAAASLTPSGALELTGDLPADKDGLTVQFVSPAASTEGLQAKFAGSDTLYPILTTGEGKEPIQAGAWEQGVPVTLTVSGGSCFFKVGAGVNDTLPPQVTGFKAVDSSGGGVPKITVSWQNPTAFFAGVLIVRKEGSAPTGVWDGVKAYTGTGTSFIDADVSFDTTYYYRAYPYNEKKQYQTLTNVVSITPKSWQMPKFTGSGYASGDQKKGMFTCLSSGTLTLDAQTYDVFVVGGGASGRIGHSDSSSGGGGGGGGYTKTQKRIRYSGSCTVVVGSGGYGPADKIPNSPGGESSISLGGVTVKADGGTNIGRTNQNYYGTRGGSGGGNGGLETTRRDGYDGGEDGKPGSASGSGAAGQNTTTRAFGEPSGSLYAGGGGGGAYIGFSGYRGGSGGSGGGGDGGNSSSAGSSGTSNTGGGGGGSAQDATGGGMGGSGVVILRWGY